MGCLPPCSSAQKSVGKEDRHGNGRLKSGGHLKGGGQNYSWPAHKAGSET